MLDWLTDPNVMEVSDQIEKVNRKMFEKLTKRNDHMAVFFCKLGARNLELKKIGHMLKYLNQRKFYN